MDTDTSLIDGSYLLPIEQLTKNNISAFSSYMPTITDISNFMQTVQTALYNYENGYTTKIVLNAADIQAYIQSIRDVTAHIGGGIDVDGATTISGLANGLLPDLLGTLRDNQLTLCQLYGLYVDTQGTLVGPIDSISIEDTSTTGRTVV